MSSAREEDFLGNKLIIHHGGDADVNRNAFILMPEENIAIIVGQNGSMDGEQDIARGILAIMMNEPVEKALPDKFLIEKLTPLFGQYTDHTNKNTLTISFQGLSLEVKVKSFYEEKSFPLLIKDIDELSFKFATDLSNAERNIIRFFIREDPHEVFIKFDRSLYFKK